MSIYLTVLFLSLFITISLVPFFARLAERYNLVDIPNARKVHEKPIPRIGGAAMAVALFAVSAAFIPKDQFIYSLLIGSGIIVCFGLADDFLNLGYKIKFVGQIAAALVVIFYGGVKIATLGAILPDSLCLCEWSSALLTLLAIVGITNAINLADGLDGLAAGICLLAFSCIAFLAYQEGSSQVLLMAIAISGAIFGFLRFNTYPASIFMGDSGSQLLGFIGIVLAIKLTQESFTLSPALPLLLFGIPILDTLAVMSQRIAEGRSPFRADKNHLHHKLMRLGLFHTEAVFLIYVIQSALIICSIFFSSASEWPLVLGYLFFSALVLTAFTVSERYGYRLKRLHFIDKGIKARLKVLKTKGVLIRFLFASLKATLFATLLMSIVLPATVTPLLAVFAALFSALLIFSLLLPRISPEAAARSAFYFMVPYTVYMASLHSAAGVEMLATIYDLSFLLLAFFAIMTLKFTRRRKGFKFSTLDRLILILVFILVLLPDKQVQNWHLGLLVTKVIVLFFSFEILVGELRGRLKRLVAGALLLNLAVILRVLGQLTI